jgi:hypothetical protein
MKIVLLTFVVLGCMVFNCIAQKTTKRDSVYKAYLYLQTKPKLSIGGEFGLPTGQVTRVYGTVIGASFKFEIPLSEKPLSLTFTTGFSSYLDKLDNPDTTEVPNSSFVPIELGLRYYLSRIVYVEGDAGASFEVGGNYSASKAAFIYSPIIGVSALTNNHKATIDIGLRYESRVESGAAINEIALRLAYRFGLK